MADPQANSDSESRRPEIVASCELWQRFDEWCERQGCTSLAEGIRTAMRQVTQFNTNCQEKSGPEPTAE